MVESDKLLKPVYILCGSMNEKRKLQDLLIRLRNGEFEIVRSLSAGDYTVKVEMIKK